MSGKPLLPLALLALLASSAAVRADEIRLKDGSKITGTIVGFENDSFRVETSYGFALIRKDKVADINITASKKDPEPASKAAAAASPSSLSGSASQSTPQNIVPAVAKEPAIAEKPGASNAIAVAPMRPPSNANALNSAGAKSDAAAPKVKTVAAVPPLPSAPPPTPPPAPAPVVIHDEIRGNQYVNSTYGFQMYKPPSWDLIPGARKALPDAVAAMGTFDQTTLLVIGRAHARDSLDAHAAATEAALKDVYENYRLISTRRVTVAGFPAIEQRSRGSAEGRDWSVILLTLFKGADAYTLLGMTYADSDLIQVQENVISKAVNSFTFVGQ